MDVYVLVASYKKEDKEWKEVCAVYKSRERAQKMGQWLLDVGNGEYEDEDNTICTDYEIEERFLIEDE